MQEHYVSTKPGISHCELDLASNAIIFRIQLLNYVHWK